MKELLNLLVDTTTNYVDNFEKLVVNKPFVSVIFPSSGFGSLFIPNNILQVTTDINPVLDFISKSTPYLKFLFLLLTILLTVVSAILQIRKLMNKNNKEDE